MNAYVAIVPLHFIYALQMIRQNKIRDCDLYYVPTSNNAYELVRQAEKTGLFRHVYMLPNISIEYPITVSQILEISRNRWKVRRMLKGKRYDTVYYNTDGWLINSILYAYLGDRRTKNVFVENGINPYVVSYDEKEWYLRLFIHLSLMRCMDGRFIDERYLFEPSLVRVRQSGRMYKIKKPDRKDPAFRKKLELIYGYDREKDSFEGKDVIIMEQGPRREPIDMAGLWKKVSGYLDGKRVIVKAHPRQKESALRELGYEMYERYVIPWEALCFQQDMEQKTLFCIFSTSCVSPKLMFDQEPRVILLYKLIGMDASFFGEGMLAFVEGVGDLYKDRSKFFIPETWDELGRYIREYV